jgi:hypothetical protein
MCPHFMRDERLLTKNEGMHKTGPFEAVSGKALEPGKVIFWRSNEDVLSEFD